MTKNGAKYMKRPKLLQFSLAAQNFMKSIQNNAEEIIVALHYKKGKPGLVPYF